MFHKMMVFNNRVRFILPETQHGGKKNIFRLRYCMARKSRFCVVFCGNYLQY